jgi:hypothetical protein
MASKPRQSAARPAVMAPELFNEFDAAHYIYMSVAYLRADRSRGHIGGTTPGPAYLRLGRTIRYRRDDLDAWLAARRIDRSATTRVAVPRARLSKCRSHKRRRPRPGQKVRASFRLEQLDQLDVATVTDPAAPPQPRPDSSLLRTRGHAGTADRKTVRL